MSSIILSDSLINDYGFRVLTSGIDLERFKSNPVMLWMHKREGNFSFTQAPLPIGKWENIRVEEDKLMGDPVFDEADDFAVKIKQKFDKGIINAASIGISIIESTNDPKSLLPGQSRPTISKSEVVEASLVDIPANKRAVRLYNKADMINLNLSDELPEFINPKNDNTMKINFKSSWDFIAKLFSFKENDQVELTEEHFEKLNAELSKMDGELTTRQSTIETLTADKTVLSSERDKAIADHQAEVALKNVAETALATAKTENEALTAEIATLRKGPGAKPASVSTKNDGNDDAKGEGIFEESLSLLDQEDTDKAKAELKAKFKNIL